MPTDDAQESVGWILWATMTV